MIHNYAAYANGKCRCAVCTAAMNTWMREYRRRVAREPLPPWISHGSVSAYKDYGCRCKPCRDAYAVYKRAYRARRKAEKGSA